MNNESFFFQGREYFYFNHPYNKTRINERAVEVPISINFADKFSENLIEVGCVLPYYFDSNHEVIDLVDEHPKSKKEDAVNFNYSGRNVLSISTVEHVGSSDYGIEEKEQNAAVKLCQKIFSESLNYFITWPLGYNKNLDSWAIGLNDSLFITRQSDNKLNWKQKKTEELSLEDKEYGTFCCANSIIILTNLK